MFSTPGFHTYESHMLMLVASVGCCCVRSYETAVMEKRLSEMPPGEMEKLMDDVEEIKERKGL